MKMMESASANYLTELGMEEPTFFHEYPMDSFAFASDDHEFFSGSPESDSSDRYLNSESTQNCLEARPSKKQKTFKNSTSQVISFEQFNASSLLNDDNRRKSKVIATTSRNPSQAQDHVIAERKRREKLNKNFIALSAIVPGLKKMDKASVLGHAIKYVKQLQEQVQTLEEQTTNQIVGTEILVKKTILVDDGEENSNQTLPEMEVRVSGKNVLIRTQSLKHRGCAATIIAQLEKHDLIVQSTTFFPFGKDTIDVTIVAQMKEENCVTAKDLLRSLRQA